MRLLEGIRLFTEAVKGLLKSKKKQRDAEDGDRISDELRASSENIQHPTTSLGAIMKLSYDEQVMNYVDSLFIRFSYKQPLYNVCIFVVFTCVSSI